jgi:hypothetical protein
MLPVRTESKRHTYARGSAYPIAGLFNGVRVLSRRSEAEIFRQTGQDYGSWNLLDNNMFTVRRNL